MTTPLIISQPSIALGQYIVTEGIYPDFASGPQAGSGAAVLGTIITTAFSAITVQQLTPALGQTESVASANALSYVLGTKFGGGVDSFGLPALGGALVTGVSTLDQVGQSQGTFTNEIELFQSQLPDTLGGSFDAVSNVQFGMPLQYLIQVSGLFPTGETGPTNATIGTIFPYAGVGIPGGFMAAAGQILQIKDHAVLYAVLGNSYGGDGATTFALPNLVNTVPIGAGGTYAIGQTVGASTIELSTMNVPNALDAQAGDYPVSTYQTSLAINYFISLDGAYNSLDYSEYPLLGQVIMFAGAYVPDGWALANGQVLSISDNAALYSRLGTQFGGDGINTFALPDLRDRAIIGIGGAENLQMGDVIGEPSSLILLSNLPNIIVTTPGIALAEDNGVDSSDQVTSSASFKLSGVWPGASVEYSVDGLIWTQTYVSKEGQNSVLVRQIDVLGQASAPSQPLVFVLDTTAPIVPSASLEDTLLSTDPDDTAVQQTLTGSIGLSSVENKAIVHYSTDGGAKWSEHFESVQGLNSVLVKQYDSAGNVSVASSVPLVFNYLTTPDSVAEVRVNKDISGSVDIYMVTNGMLPSGLGTNQLTDTLYSDLQHALVLPQDIENIELSGIGSGNTVVANHQDNRMTVIEGSWRIDGAEGFDTVVLPGTLSSYVISQHDILGQPEIVIIGPDGKLELSNTEMIRFSDASLSLSSDQETLDIYRLYETALNRNPDFPGLEYWMTDSDNGSSLSAIADAFIASSEFAHLYGAPLSTLQYLDVAYETLLGRASDESGESYWLAQINSGSISLGAVWVSLMSSAEGVAYSTSHTDIGLTQSAALIMV